MTGTPTQPTPPKTGLRRIAAVAGIVSIGVAIIVTSIAASVAVIQFFGEPPSTGSPGSDARRLEQAQTLALLAMQAATLGLTVIVARGWGPIGTTLAWRAPVASAHDYRRIVAATLALLLVTTVAALLLFRQTFEQDIDVFRPMIQAEDWPLAILALVIGAPLSEELLFRGLLLGGLVRQGTRFVSAAFVTNLMWTALHAGYSLMGLIEVFIAGLLLSWALYVTRSVWVPILIHVFYNAISLLMIVFVIA